MNSSIVKGMLCHKSGKQQNLTPGGKTLMKAKAKTKTQPATTKNPNKQKTKNTLKETNKPVYDVKQDNFTY